MRSRDRDPGVVTARPVQIVPIKEEDMQPRWEKLSEEMAEKKQNLEELIRNTSVCGVMMMTFDFTLGSIHLIFNRVDYFSGKIA